MGVLLVGDTNVLEGLFQDKLGGFKSSHK